MICVRSWLACGAAALPLLTTNAGAQQAPRQKVESVEVAGRKPAVQSLADRQIYAIDHDLQSATGSVSGVLKNLPSIEVDVQGNISLRGDPNVTILIDGKPSPLLAGGAEALEQIPAENIAQIEVITNPSAQFKPDGSGGIINIVTRKDVETGRSGSVRANAGSEGRSNVSASGSAKFGRYAVSASVAYRRDMRHRTGENDRFRGGETDTQTTSNKTKRQMLMVRLRGEAEIDDRNSLEASFSARAGQGRLESSEHNVSQSGSTTTSFDRFGRGPAKRQDVSASLEYTHEFAKKGEVFKLELQRGTDWDDHRIEYTNVTPGGPGSYDLMTMKGSEVETEISADYVLPLENGAKFKTGYVYESEQNEYNNLGQHRDGTSVDWVIDPNFTSRFLVEQAVHAGYATYETKFDKLGVLAGLRLEQTIVTAEQRTMAVTNKSNYLDLYPSLHLTYDLTASRQLRMSYSRRINRPDDHDINPSLEYRDAFNVSSGNPRLKPEITASLEAGYKYTGEKLDTLLTVYYRGTRNGFTDVSRYISDTVLLTTTENLAKSIRAGLEFTANGDLGSDLSFRLSANGYYSEIDPGPLSDGVFRSGLAWTGKLSFDYKLTPDDQLQLSGDYSARRFTAQGYRLPTFNANAGYRHKFTPDLSGVVTVTNLFDSHKDKIVLDGPGLHDVAVRRQPGRIFFVGLVYSFGGQREEGEQPGDNPEE